MPFTQPYRPSVPKVSAPPNKVDDKPVTVYVGKISPSVPDELMKTLLETCGKCKWRRVTDPVTGEKKGFGFCDYESPEGGLLAIQLLNERVLHSQALMISCVG